MKAPIRKCQRPARASPSLSVYKSPTKSLVKSPLKISSNRSATINTPNSTGKSPRKYFRDTKSPNKRTHQRKLDKFAVDALCDTITKVDEKENNYTSINIEQELLRQKEYFNSVDGFELMEEVGARTPIKKTPKKNSATSNTPLKTLTPSQTLSSTPIKNTEEVRPPWLTPEKPIPTASTRTRKSRK